MSRDWNGDFFKAGDFKEHLQSDSAFRVDGYYEKVARIANKILRGEIEKLTTVYGEVSFGSFSGLPDKWTIDADPHNSHTTKILPPKEIG